MTAMEWWSLAAIALWMKTVGLATLQGQIRMRKRVFVRPEDAAFFGKGMTPSSNEHDLVARAQRAIGNDLENVPAFLALALAYAHFGCWELGAPIYFLSFVVTRYLHGWLMLFPRQPLRTGVYSLGVLSQLALAVHVVVAILTQ